jgi:hypothetical protein
VRYEIETNVLSDLETPVAAIAGESSGWSADPHRRPSVLQHFKDREPERAERGVEHVQLLRTARAERHRARQVRHAPGLGMAESVRTAVRPVRSPLA